MSDSQTMPYFREAPAYHRQYQEDPSPTIPSKMIKKLAPSNRVDNTLDFLSAPKRKREDSIDLISASRQQDSDNDDDDFVLPLHKRSASSNRLCRSSFCLSSYDSEAREGPADDVLDDETEALVKNFRTSIFRYEPPSPSSTSTPYKEDEDDDEEDNCIDYFPAIGRATTISDSSESDDEYADPPDMAGSRPASPHAEEILEQDDGRRHHRDRHDWSPSGLSLDYHRRDDDKDPIEAARERPEWLSGTTSPRSTLSAAPSEPSPLWMTSSQNKGSSWPGGWTGMFHQGSA